MAKEQIETWYNGKEKIIIDVNSPVQVKSFTKKGYGPEKKMDKPSTPVKGK